MRQKVTMESVASQRLRVIAPLLENNLDSRSLVNLKKRIAKEQGLSYRTLTRYYEAYQTDGFEGLKPKSSPSRPKTLGQELDRVLKEAIDLRRELPTRSVNDILRILEMEGVIQKGSLPRSTLQRHLQASGFGAKQVKIYSQKGIAAKRFQKTNRMMLLQGDIKYGPYLPIGKNGQKKQVYLSVFIDDATRYIVGARFYENQKVEIVEDTLRMAVMCYGKPDKIFVDNGKQYRSHWLKNACEQLGIKLRFAKPYSPSAKGKVEYFNKRVDAFLAEVALNQPKTLEELNTMFDLWVQNYYHCNPHKGLNGLSPREAFQKDRRSLTFVSMEQIRQAFLHQEVRKVDKTGCIHLGGYQYEVGMHLIARKVTAFYDPIDRESIQIQHKDFGSFEAKRLIIGENCGASTSLPDGLQAKTPNGSRLLHALQKDGSLKTGPSIRFKEILGGNQDV